MMVHSQDVRKAVDDSVLQQSKHRVLEVSLTEALWERGFKHIPLLLPANRNAAMVRTIPKTS